MSSTTLGLLARQDAAPADPAAPACQADETVNDYAQLRIASIFVILVGSLLGAVIPVWLARYRTSGDRRWLRHAFFITKYFGSGVIIGTAFMHLISPATEILGQECLKPVMGEYDWSMAIVLMVIMTMFLIELLASWAERRKDGDGYSASPGGSDGSHGPVVLKKQSDPEAGSLNIGEHGDGSAGLQLGQHGQAGLGYAPGSPEHLAHRRTHSEGDSHIVFGGKVTSIVILEAGVVLHSVFIGLTLAVSSGFVILFIVLVFHQTFEGLGLGSRLATFQWPTDRRRWTPWVFAVLYGLTTPVAIAAGLGVKDSLSQNPTARFMVEGISNAISGGILLYTGVVELMAHEFMFNPEMDKSPLSHKLLAYLWMALGAGLMALLAKWA